MKMSDAFKEGLIPAYYDKYFPVICPDCGEDLHISSSLTNYRCVNKNCIQKRAVRLSKFLYGLGIKNFGRDLAYEYFKENTNDSILDILVADKDKLPKKMSARRKSIYKSKFTEIANVNLQFKELVQLLDMPNIDKDIIKIFRGVNSYQDYQDLLDKYGSHFELVKVRLGMKSITRPKYIATTLMEYDSDIQMIEKIFKNMKYDNGRYTLICMTGIPAGYTDKERFLREMSDILGVNLELTASLEKAVFVVYSAKGTETYRNAYANYRKKLITPGEFVEIVKEAAKSGER